MKSAFPAPLCFENMCHDVDEEHKLLVNSPQPTNGLASSSKMSIYPRSFCFGLFSEQTSY